VGTVATGTHWHLTHYIIGGFGPAWQISQQGVQAWVGSQHRGDIQVVNRVQIDLRVNTVTIHQAMQCHRVVAAQTA
jgi:hypothetical protein